MADPLEILLQSEVIRQPPTEQIIPLFVGDNVHLTATGYGKLAAGISRCFEKAVVTKASPSVNVSGAQGGHYYWRGFNSPHGAVRVSNTAGNYNAVANRARGRGRGGGGRQHPYRGR